MLATGMLERMRGLLGRKPLGDDEGLLLDPCSSVHTLGMKYPIDLVFLTAGWRIGRIIAELQPLRMAWHPGARRALELRAGAARQLGLSAGQELAWQERD